MPRSPPSRWKGKLCSKCGGQLNESTALNLRDKKTARLVRYVTCPGDCSGHTRKDLDAGEKK